MGGQGCPALRYRSDARRDCGRRSRVDTRGRAARLDPAAPKAVSDEDERASIRLSAKEEEILRRILSRHLRYDFGYDFF
ncbi:MAG: hypothetical protein AMXMBFR74_01180 [Parvibaculum sp.]